MTQTYPSILVSPLIDKIRKEQIHLHIQNLINQSEYNITYDKDYYCVHDFEKHSNDKLLLFLNTIEGIKCEMLGITKKGSYE